ncbi:MAG TPA: glycosyltransferase 87 family protein [Anaerolineales bacterium]
MLIVILIALLALSRFPFLSGAAVMIGGLIKLYPLVMGAPLLLMKKWKALLGAFVTGAIIIFLQTNFGRDFHLWRQFLQFFICFPVERESSEWIRNTTFLSLARNLNRFAELPESMITPLYLLCASVILIWIAVRFIQREKTYPTLSPGYNAEVYRIFGNLLDFSRLALLVTPTAWDHHYVIALPLALWAIAIRGKDQPGWVGFATVCIFVLPPFDIFPLSYLRMFGVITLLILTSPGIHSNLNYSIKGPAQSS